MNDLGRPRVLCTPLNWGIGHATRSIPLIIFLLEQGLEVELAACGQAYAVLAEQFPQLNLHRSPPFEVRYGSGSLSSAWQMFQSGLRLQRHIHIEQAWLKDRFPTGYFQAVVSDNAYGMYMPGAHNVLITHQLTLRSGMGTWVDTALTRRIGALCTPFQEIWIPDFENQAQSLAGALSHPQPSARSSLVYLGPLSRLTPATNSQPQTILFLISGPEPQRTYFEKIAHQVAAGLKSPVVLVGGKPAESVAGKVGIQEREGLGKQVTSISYANQQQLSQLLSAANVVVARSGYSSVMDVVRFGKKAVWVPTPGQGEQQYLATYLSKKHPHFLQASQTVADIQAAVEALMQAPHPTPIDSNGYESPLRDWCSTLKDRK